jgi:chromate reductase, NAD(P)H dehydrogenase (quinone)
MSQPAREPVRFLIFGASLRAGSANARLATIAARHVEANGGEVDLATMNEFDCPSYDQDVQDSQGFPAGAERLRGRLLLCDALVISSPEYNASMPGVLKNALDWVSRFRPQPLDQHHALIMSASPSMTGGNRGAWALRVPLEHLGARVYPDMFSLSQAHLRLDDQGNMTDAELTRRFESTITSFMDLVEASKHYPWVKKAWYEYLGQLPDPECDRVQ